MKLTMLCESANRTILYHITVMDRLPSIQKDGLIPSRERGMGGFEGQHDPTCVYLGDKLEVLRQYKGQIAGNQVLPADYKPGTYKYPKFAILEIDTTGLEDKLLSEMDLSGKNWQDSLRMFHGVRYRGNISPDRIKVIVQEEDYTTGQDRGGE